jgi:alpha-tubulin suppressor-like RCC1 family protein
LEIGGYFQLKYAEKTFPVVRRRLAAQLVETFAVDEAVAEWILNVFSIFLGYTIEDDGAVRRSGAQGAHPISKTNPKSLNDVSKRPSDFTSPNDISKRPNNFTSPNDISKRPNNLTSPNDTKRPTNFEKSPNGILKQPNDITKTPMSPFIGDERRPIMTVPRPKFSPEKKAFLNRRFAQKISADYHSVAVVRDGQVKAVGTNSDGQCNTNTYDWRDMVAVSAGANFTVGLRADGTVVGVGRNDFGQLNVKDWTDIKSVSAGARHTVGLRGDGTLLACGQSRYGECKISHWRNIVHAVAGQDCTFGIKKDGKVLVSGNNQNGNLLVSHLEGVVDIAFATPLRIIALLQDGTIVRVGKENIMRKNFSQFKNVRQISAAPDYFAGLFEDGTVRLLAYFWQDSGVEAATADWREIIAIAAGRHHIVGMKSNNTLAAEMLHPDISRNKGQINIGTWEM